jgi:hypothetical protein
LGVEGAVVNFRGFCGSLLSVLSFFIEIEPLLGAGKLSDWSLVGFCTGDIF